MPVSRKIKVFEKGSTKNIRIAVMVSDFHPDIAQNLLKGCFKGFSELGFLDHQIEVFHVPGAFEIPFLAKKLLNSAKYRAIIALGCLIRGETDHYEQICNQVSRSLMDLNLEGKIPLIFEVLMVNRRLDAVRRADKISMSKNKGYASAFVAAEMLKYVKEGRS